MSIEYDSVNISLPVEVIKTVDARRGDIPRSRFISRILEKALFSGKKKEVL